MEHSYIEQKSHTYCSKYDTRGSMEWKETYCRSFLDFWVINYAHIPNEKMRKLENKGEKFIFLGVSDKSKAYKLYNPSTMKIVISCDVVFDEKDTWSWNQNGVKENILVGFDDDEKVKQLMGNKQEDEVI